MYDRHLDTFVQVADSGSFLKASEKLYISANAVTKQINLLENDLGVRLFQRSTQGLALTEAGQFIYAEAKKLIRHSRSVLQKAKELENKQEYVIRVGVSLMNPANILLEQWHKASALYPNFRLEIVPFEDTVSAFQDVLDSLGSKIDLLSCPYETSYWGNRYNSFHLRDLPLCVSCSMNHPLATKQKLSLEDLHGETLLVGRKGFSAYIDRAWDYIVKHHPQIDLKEVAVTDLPTFNHVVSSGNLILSAECWKGVHPLLATIPVDWEFTMPYGLIYAKDPPNEVLQFIMAVGQTNIE